ncbi:hypothetical protein FRC10_011351 [Ceratobasidium sp. 414]|nr:hypothetical protein FRC10_011351 [Ceratobasidium sp. 414]
MYGHREYQEAPQWRLDGEPMGSAVPSDMEHVYSPRGSHVFAPGHGDSADFFRELQRTRSAFQEDMLFGVAGRSLDDLEQALLLRTPAQFTGRSLPSQRFGEQVERDGALAYSLEELVEKFTDEEGNLKPKARRALLTGTMSNQDIIVDWLKDQEHLIPDWFLASTDVDSLSLTVSETEISDFVSLYPYPDRAMSLNISNNLWVNVSPGRRVLMHQCPNICMGTLGSNGQFRWMVFWPNRMEQTVSRHYRNYVNEEEGTVWYDNVFLRALHIAQMQAPINLRPLVLNTIRVLPKSYRIAEIQCTGGGPRSFLRFKVPPLVINLVLPIMRHLVNTTPSLASYRDYFFHFCGINLKAVGLTVHGQCNNNPLDNVFKTFNIVPWHQQNPNNIMVDVGLELALDPARLPYRKPETTMIWRQSRLYRIWKDIWEQQRWDDYLHSSTVGGFAASPAFPMDCGMIKLQCYMKDKGMTYVHSDRSVGTNFSVKDVLHRTKKYHQQLKGSVETWGSGGTFGVRMEWRCTPWAARQMLAKDPQIWVDRLYSNGAIVCHKTQVVSGYKIMMLNVYKETFERLQRLEATENVKLLACATAYLLRGLTKRPDSMSSSVQMAKGFGITDRAVTHGLASIHPDFLDKNRTAIHPDVDCTEYNILRHTNTIRPGGQRIKGIYQIHGLPRTFPVRRKPSEMPQRHAARRLPDARSHLTPTTPATTDSVNHPEAPIRATTAPSNSAGTGLGSSDWETADQKKFQEIFEKLLPNWLWSRFPRPHLRRPEPKQAFRAKRQPLTQFQFQKLVAEDTEIHPRQHGGSGFTKVVDQLFPAGWRLDQASLTSTMQSYDQVCLQQIRSWIGTRPLEQQPEFSRVVRTRIQLALRSWEFLPAIRKDVVWSTIKVAGIKQFAVYMNPDFTK